MRTKGQKIKRMPPNMYIYGAEEGEMHVFFCIFATCNIAKQKGNSVMKLSILIPTYNFDCSGLVATLAAQLPDDCEVVVGDDCSTEEGVRNRLQGLQGEHVRLIRPERNLGSAGMRNMLCREAKGEYLLFVDCDAIVEDGNFVARYLAECDGSVVCGTVKHPDKLPSPRQSLRWRYEKAMEARFTAEEANKSSYQHFRTFHFLVPRSVMLAVPFNEAVKSSGYEDLLFGKQLANMGIPVRHTEIAATNGDIETNDVFLQKTERHMRTLYQMRQEIGAYSTLLTFRSRLERHHLSRPLRFLFHISRPLLRWNLQGAHPSVRLFQFYKLGYFLDLETAN